MQLQKSPSFYFSILLVLITLTLSACNSDSSDSASSEETLEETSTDDTSDDTSDDTTDEDDSDTEVTEYATSNVIGLLLNSADAQNGYTLFGGQRFSTTYLIDNCGEMVQSWSSDYSTMSSYLLENGNLLHTGRLQSAVNSEFLRAGGDSGRVEIINEQDELQWYYECNSDTQFMHHDVEYIESTGTVLVMVWNKHSAAEAEAVGYSRNHALWSEQIIELDPTVEDTEDAIVWQWDSWDHIVQDEDLTIESYGVISENPQLIDINFTGIDVEYEADPIHMNAVTYNEKFDQIMINSRNYSEFWIIDHSTTTAEAASHSGGARGKGGDILYRWGNPQTYDMGDADDQKLFLQHDAYWIDDDYTEGGQVMSFNNQPNYYGNSNYSTINVVDTQVSDAGDYTLNDDGTYGPTDFTWTYEADNPTDFYATNISGAQRLDNGNTIIDEGTTGTFFEVTYDGEVVWKYVTPVDETGVLTQGDTPGSNFVFRINKYPTDYIGLSYYSLSPSGAIENGSDYSCELFE
ncbi:aryl-sulfate sulfotransferase [uncultured Alteromonas sp.]|uniref:aryl-sulfate sulfotransferase n=1 Tax=uncultured Alteromonas sp. TaxID=179113 RepID=UPI0030EE8E99